jgi:hypothetical protein
VGRALEQVVAALEAAGPTVRDRAEAGIGAFVHAMLDDPRAARVVCVEVVGVSDELEAHRRQVLRAFADVVAEEARRLIATGDVVRRRDPRPVSLALVGGVNELVVDWLQSDEHVLPLDEVVAEMADLFVAAGVGPPDWRPTRPSDPPEPPAPPEA